MIKTKSVVFFIASIFTISGLTAQVKIGEWRAHLNYKFAKKAVEAEDFIYCATQYGLFNIHKTDNTMTMLSRVDGLSGVEIETIDYDPTSNNVFVAYEDGQLDMLGPDYIVPIPYISNASSIIGDKRVKNFFFANGLAYMATNFGVVVYDIEKREIRESYLNLDERGNQLAINDVAVYQNRVYICTDQGLRSGSLNDNLLDFTFWRTDMTMGCNVMQVYNDKLIIHLSDNRLLEYDGSNFVDFAPLPWSQVRHIDVQNGRLAITQRNNLLFFYPDYRVDSVETNSPSHGLMDKNGVVWLSNYNNGLIKIENPYRYATPNGPAGPSAWDFAYANGQMWVASGGVNLAYNPRFLNNGIYVFKEQRWFNFNGNNKTALLPLRDMHRVRIDESTNTKYVASYNKGLAVFDENDNVTVYDYDNTNGVLGRQNNSTDPNAWIMMAGIDLDTQGNLWMSLQYTENQLAVKLTNGKWQSFNLGNEKRVTEVLCDNEGQKWVAIHLNGIYVFNDGGTPMNTSDDKVRRVDQSVGNGNLPASDVYSMMLDRNGDIWVGTGDGVAVIYSPQNVFETDPNSSFDASRPLIQEGDAVGYLLEGQKVNCIAIDGANQKWFGTDNGVFVTNEDGDEIIYRFNTENSPLLSNVVRRIGIDGGTGEVFLATDKGIISYRAIATEGDGKPEGIYVYPNPVEPSYEGPIAITGLVENANVKITDLNGNLVYETTAQGGTAVWYGKTFGGRDVSSGVYLAFSSDRDGRKTHISKIMIIR
jgi:ligand-binding sensor domain-containing protein